MIFSLSFGELLILSLFFITSINCITTYICCTKSLKIYDVEKTLRRAANKLRIYDQYLLSKISVISTLLYYWISYMFIEEILPNNNYSFFLACLLSFPLTLLTTFVSRVCYCYTGNILLETKLNELECLFLNLKRLILLYLPFLIISLVIPTIYLLDFDQTILNIVCISVLMFMMLLWVVLSAKFTIWNYKAKKIENNTLLRYRVEKLMQKHGIKRYELYLWDTSRSKESNAMVSGFIKHNIFISSSLVEELTLPELETVITHEIGHMKNNHLMKLMIGKIFIIASLVAIVIIPHLLNVKGLEKGLVYFVGTIIVCLEIVVGAKIERGYENEADIYASCYNDPELFASALTKISKYEDENTKLDDLFQSHPSTKKRIKKVRKKDD